MRALPVLLLAGIAAHALDPERIHARVQGLRSLHRPLPPVRPGDWLANHPERGQTFRQYVSSQPNRPTPDRRTLYLQPIGTFSPGQQRVLKAVREGLEAALGLTVVIRSPIPTEAIPPSAQRPAFTPGGRQLLTGWVLDQRLLPELPKDAAACLGLSSMDLWPGEGWNFVFGIARLHQRVGVWSFARFGDPDASAEAYTLCHRRVYATALHEALHLFGFLHCTAHPCLMNGSNSLDESDRQPLWLCPECLAKLAWATDQDLETLVDRLQRHAASSDWPQEAAHQGEALRRLRGRPGHGRRPESPMTDPR